MSTQAERASRRRKDKQKQRKKKKQLGAPYLVTRALTHIRLDDANTGKLAALDTLTPVYLALCQQYVEQFCNEESPNALFPPCYPSVLSERWQRACIMQAAGIAKSWLSNRTNAARAHQEALTRYQEALKEYEAESQRAEQDKKTRHPKAPRAPRWNEWPIPVVKAWCLQANVNVARIEPSEDSSFDYWLTVATLEKGKPIRLPVKLADYHKKTLTKREKPSEDIEADVLPMPLEVTAAPYKRPLNSSVTLNKRDDAWWLTVTYDDEIVDQTPDDAPVVGIDVGIANLVTTSTNKHYGTMHGKLRAAHKRDRGKRQRKAKLRACLKKKGAKKVPSTSSKRGQRLIRQTKQEINRAINQCFEEEEHQGCQFAYEDLSVASMRFKARSMNAYLKASHLGRIPDQIAWNGHKRGIKVTAVPSAYTSQECSQCHYTDRKNRPDQKTFFCQVCEHKAHADVNASKTVASRIGDRQLLTCRERAAIKSLLLERHEQWKQQQGWEDPQPVIQTKRVRSVRKTR